MKAPKFRDFITEAKKEKYKLLVITDEPEKAKTFHTADRLREEAEKLGWDYYLYKLTGGYTTCDDGVRIVKSSHLIQHSDEAGELFITPKKFNPIQNVFCGD